jgi:hypothetical protein
MFLYPRHGCTPICRLIIAYRSSKPPYHLIPESKELVSVLTRAERQWSSAKTQISTRMEGETVILNVASGRYFSLDGVGSHLWEALREPRSPEALLGLVLEHYEVDAETAKRDIATLLGSLEEAGLVESR